MRPVTFLLERLSVSHFGGVNGFVDLDCRAPLTVIYAPNGTGKTSLVEAVYWAFHSGDQREVREPRCLAADRTVDTTVALTVGGPEGRHTFTRSLASTGVDDRFVDGVRTPPVEYLRRLAPECSVAELNPLSQKARLVRYLCANRIVTSRTLSHLIDSNNAQLRAEAMADLLGTRAQQNAIKQLSLYSQRLAQRIAADEAEVSWRLGRREALLPKVETAETDLAQLTNDICGLLHLPVPQDASNVQLSLERSAEEQRLAVASDQERLELLARALDGDAPEAVVRSLERTRKEIAASRAANDASVARAEDAVKRHQAGLRSQRKEIDLLKSLDAIADEIAAIVRERGTGDIWRDLRRHAEAVATAFGAAATARRQWADLEKGLAQWGRTAATIESRQTAIETASKELSKLRSVSELNSDIRQVDKALELEVKRVELLADARADLLAASNELLKISSEESRCPTCGHDWKTHQRLRTAIEKASASIPGSRKDAAERVQSLRRQRKAFESALRARGELEGRMQELGKALKTARERQRSTLAIASRFSIKEPWKRSDDVIGSWMYRLSIAELFEKIDSIDKSTLSSPALPDEKDSVDLWCQALRDRTKAARARLTRFTEELEKEQAQVVAGRRTGAELEARLAAVDHALKAARTTARQCVDALRHFAVTELSAAIVAGITERISHRADELRRAVAALVVRRAALEAREARQETDALNAELRPREHCLAELRSELARAERTIETIEDTVSRQNVSVFSQLAPVVSQLFKRMQVNRVFNKVEVDSELHLSGLLGALTIQPELFSDGQRQDLALSLFLARAYSMGGTFLLDEPLVHLDDVNRVALLDTLRAFIMSGARHPQRTHLALTTASWLTTRHIIEKFVRADHAGDGGSLRVYQLRGNVNIGVHAEEVYPRAIARRANEPTAFDSH